jgi:hypothetical protein
LNDDIFKKLKTILSGSKQLNKETSNEKKANSNDEELINSFMNQILDAAWVEEDMKAMCSPSYHLSKKSKSYWLINTTLKSLFNVNSGIEIIPIEPGETHTVCLIGQSTFSIPNDLIVLSGWN